MPVDIIKASSHATELMAAAIFAHKQPAEIAIGLLQQAGFDLRTMSYLQRQGEVLKELAPPVSVVRPEGADALPALDNPLMAAVSGGAIGGAAGLLIGLGMMAIPGIGPFVAAGTLATLLSSAAVGAAAGGIGGALLLWGAPDDIAHQYARELEGNCCLLVVFCPDEERQTLAADELERAGGSEVRTFTRLVR